MRRRLSSLLQRVVDRFRDWAGSDSTQRPPEPSASTFRDPPTPEHGDTPSSEEQVVAILEAEDGPVWQNALVEASGWSKSTISRTLSDLEEEGEIVRSRIGRRKVVFVAGEEPPVVDPPEPPEPATPERPPSPSPHDGATAERTARSGPGSDEPIVRDPTESPLDD